MKQRTKDIIKNSSITLALLIAATGLGCLYIYWNLQETNVVVTYILSVLLVSRLTKGYVYGLTATVLSLISYNWFFTAPFFSLKVYDPTYLITFLIMTFTAMITGALTSKVKEQAYISGVKENESNILYKMTNLLTDAEDQNAIAGIAAKTVSSILCCDAAIIRYDENGNLEDGYLRQCGETQRYEMVEDKKALSERLKNLHALYDIDEHYYNFPIEGRSMHLAVLRIPKNTARILTEEQKKTVFSIIESTSLALERLTSLQAQAKSREEATQEHYRGNLLRAISHDIRTPLSAIMGSVEMLMDMTDAQDPRYAIAEGVYHDADWLHSLVENILNLTKLHDGRMHLSKQLEAVEEVVASALMVIEKRYPNKNIELTMPDEFLMVPMDAKLISQVIINLLDNAAKHTPDGRNIHLRVRRLSKSIECTVEDEGSGIVAKDLQNIFQMFYTTGEKSADSEKGIGLGLTICQSIVQAHGGEIHARNRVGGGAEFSFTLPMQGDIVK